MKKQLLLFIFSMFTFSMFAQKGTIRGTVFEGSTGFSIIGGNVSIKDTSIGTVTDLDGTFSSDVEPGIFDLLVTYVGFQTLTIEDVEVKAGQVTLLESIRIQEAVDQLAEVVVTAKAIKTSEVALLVVKKNSAVMMDGISSAKFKLTGDGTAVEAAKRVTGVSVEGGKYVYIRGLGDRYSKTTLNGMDIPGLDPDKNTLQMDIFPTNLIDNIVVSKNFTADMPADFTGGMLNIETKDFPEEKIFTVSVGTTVNPNMHFNSDYLTYKGGDTDFLGFDDGTRDLPRGAEQQNIPTPISCAFDKQVNNFVKSFNPELGATRETSLIDYSASISMGNQFNLKSSKTGKSPKLGYIFSLSYKTDYKYYDDVIFSEYQRYVESDQNDLFYANLQTGAYGEQNVLIGALAGMAYKTSLSKIRLTAMRLQNGESRAGMFTLDNNGDAVGQSGYLASSDNLEYNERSMSNFLLNGTHVIKDSGWEIDWRLSPTFSTSDDPDIRKTAFTIEQNGVSFNAGAGGNPVRIWRSLSEMNAVGKFDITKKYTLFNEKAKLKFGASHIYKQRDYKILSFDLQFFAQQSWTSPDPSSILTTENIYPNKPNSIYYQSGNDTPNPNEYESNVNNTGFYVSNEFSPFPKLNAILGVRAENYVQRHTGRDQAFAQGNPAGRNLDNEKVLESLDFFPSANLIYSLTDDQKLRTSYSRTIARPSFKELSFAQIIDPITNRIFNGALFPYTEWNGVLSETRVDNIDLRWELYLKRGEIISVSGFYKGFDKPIELVRIPEQQTSTEFQPRNVRNGQLYGLEFEIRKNLDFLSPALRNVSFSSNLTFVESIIDMTQGEFDDRRAFEKAGETIDNTRQMAGQAPYVINAGLTYSDGESGWETGLFYNVKGATLSIVGSGLYPDIYTEPFHSLNFSINKKLGESQNTTIDFKVANILNDKVESNFHSFKTENQLFSSINPGRAFSLGLSHNF